MTHLNQGYCFRNASDIEGMMFLEIPQVFIEFEGHIRAFRYQFNGLLFLKMLMFYGDAD